MTRSSRSSAIPWPSLSIGTIPSSISWPPDRGSALQLIALGLTNYLYNRVMSPYADTFNTGNTFNTIKIPVLGNIPIIGPIFFDANIFLYITYALILVIQIGLFRTRWWLRVRAVG